MNFIQLGNQIDVKNARRPTIYSDDSKIYFDSITISGIHNLIYLDLTKHGKFLVVSNASSLYTFSLKFFDGKTSDSPDRIISMRTMVISLYLQVHRLPY